jgi:hypothetical protein
MDRKFIGGEIVDIAKAVGAAVPQAGTQRCCKCTCTGYSNLNQNENSYCDCGHPYSDHW